MSEAKKWDLFPFLAIAVLAFGAGSLRLASVACAKEAPPPDEMLMLGDAAPVDSQGLAWGSSLAVTGTLKLTDTQTEPRWSLRRDDGLEHGTPGVYHISNGWGTEANRGRAFRLRSGDVLVLPADAVEIYSVGD